MDQYLDAQGIVNEFERLRRGDIDNLFVAKQIAARSKLDQILIVGKIIPEFKTLYYMDDMYEMFCARDFFNGNFDALAQFTSTLINIQKLSTIGNRNDTLPHLRWYVALRLGIFA